jgi:hypothetical protein
MNVGGLKIYNILLDSGAQSNVISMGTLTQLAGLEKGDAFRMALKTCKWTPPTANHIVAGLGGNTMAVQGTVLLPIVIKGEVYKLAFTLIYQPTQTMIIGTSGLRALKFKLTSPLFSNVNFLDRPRDRLEQKKENDERAKLNESVAQKEESMERNTSTGQAQRTEELEKKSVFKRKAEKKKNEEPQQKRKPGRPPKQPQAQDTKGAPKNEKEIKDPMVRVLLGQPPLSDEKKQKDFRQEGAAKKM